MTNPGPRPALRKAPDADIHPARAAELDAETAAAAYAVDLRDTAFEAVDLRQAPPAPRTVVPIEKPAPLGASEVQASEPKPGRSKSIKSKDHGKKPKKLSKKERKKLIERQKAEAKKARKDKKNQAPASSNKRIDLSAKVSADVRQSLRGTAKARGTSVDGAVSSVVDAWRSH